ncbi:substrate-binding domain-containing protein [Tardiphaga sp.]|uniref:substrate-binding domain-containing protein n=1 Tax=Tardiphaga sp. TaxID=1926292 RepID=UPI003529FE10
MSRHFRTMRLHGTASVLALSTAALIGSSAMQPANALDGIYGGGSSLVSLAMRQIMDCYGTPLDPNANPPATCPLSPDVQGQYAAVGSGNGFRGFISNDPHQLFLGSPTPTIAMPAKPPVYVDETGGPLSTYPYPNIDFGASDSPLSSAAAPVTTSFVTFTPSANWVTTTTTFSPVTATGSVTTTYATAAFGAPIQLPLIEAPVAIAINTNTLTVKSASSTPSNAGGAIQLSTAQICAIFSGAVTNWNSTGSISFINSSGALSTQAFNAANIGGGSSAAVAYSGSSLPIKVVHRSDGSGTSFIITNYLKSVCPQLDDGSNKYAQIFTGSLPSNSFSQLIANINAAFPGAGRTTNWVATDGSQNVAQAINNSSGGSTFNGRIGYLSADFTQPYLSASVASYAPLSASVQNEALRVAGTYLPAASSGGSNAPTFIPPTPAGADVAFGSLTVPAAGATHNDWNVYGQVWPATVNGGVTITGLSKLGIPTAANSYPIVGTAFGAAYSCYRADGGAIVRATRIKDFLNWYFEPDATSPPANSVAKEILAQNGFGALPTALRAAARTKANTIEAAGSGTCATMAGG